jgi:Type IX secretion system protein PorV
MKKATLKLAALALLIGGISTTTNAQTTASNNINVVTTAVPMLRITPDARATGMGETGIATSADAYSSFWNLGKTPFAKKQGSVAVTYTPWLSDLNLKDVYLANLGGYYKLDESQAITLGLRYFSLGNIQFTDATGATLGSQNPREFSIDGGYSRKLGAKSGLGLGVRYISSNLATGPFNGVIYKKGSTVAADLHYFHNGVNDKGEGLNWGATLSNLGGKISYTNDNTQRDFIPANLGLGASYTKAFDDDNKLTFNLDVNKLMVPTPDTGAANLLAYRNTGVAQSWTKGLFSAPGGGSEKMKELTAGIGAEYWYKDQFAFRAGYFYESPVKGNRKYATVGAGLKYSSLAINLSYIFPSGSGITRIPLSNTIRFSLAFDIDKSDKK